MSKILVVFGATGQQGGSVINYVINDSELSKQYKVRGVTRDISKPAAVALQQKGVEVVSGDAEDKESLKEVLKDAHTVFALSTTIYDERLKERELSQGKTVADAAVAASAKYLIFSTLTHVTKTSGGKYQNVHGFDAKAEVEQYIRTLPIKSAFFSPSSFMQNFDKLMAPHPNGDGTYSISNVVSPQTSFPIIEIVEDTGKYIGAILAEPDKYEGKVFCAATSILTFEEIVQTISKVTGKTVTYKQLPENVMRGFLPSKIAADNLIEMMLYIQDFGYWGPQTKEHFEWTVQNVRGKLTTLEEYLAKHPIQSQ